MADSEAGPSGIKKRKCDIPVKKALADEELIILANCSDDEELFLSDSDLGDNFGKSSSSEENSDDEPLANLVRNPTNPTNLTLNWNDNINIKKQPFVKTEQLLEQPAGIEPIDYFNLIFDNAFLELIVNQTNIYAVEILCSEGKTEQSRISRWRDLTVPELKVFLGLLLHTGTIQLNRLQDYWKKDPLFNISCFGEYMSRNRFLLILRALHFAKNPSGNEPVPQDRLHKIRPLIDLFNDRMNSVFYPGKELSLDESMVLWRGRLVFRQYIKNKKHRYGIKLYMLTTPNGIVLKFAVYTGVLDDMGGKGHAANVVLHLMNEKLDNGHSLYMDNFYNSFALAKQLLDRKTNCTGTLRKDRKDCPMEVKNAKLRKGETVAKYCNGVMVGKWKDKRDVHYISTEFPNIINETRNRRNEVKEKPVPIIQYNKFMSGIDRQDQMLSYYPCERKTVRWPTKLGIHILQISLQNAFHLYNTYSGKKMTLYDFRLSIIRALLGPKVEKPLVPKDHVLKKCDKSKSGLVLRRKCKSCSANGRRRETTYECPACPGNPGYCLDCCQISHQLPNNGEHYFSLYSSYF